MNPETTLIAKVIQAICKRHDIPDKVTDASQQVLEIWYRKYYPEMFELAYFQERVTLYQMLDALHLLKNWYKETPELYEQLEIYIKKLK